MKTRQKHPHSRTAALIASATFLFPQLQASAGVTDLADMPLANATTVEILPNIYFILDDSGSMDWDFMPDYATNNWCRGNDGSNTLQNCAFGDPPFNAAAFNGTAYNPLIDYLPPKNADGSEKTSYGSPWTNVPNDGYGKQNRRPDGITTGSSIDLTTGVPRRVWCSDAGLTTCVDPLDGTNAYVYPDGTYQYVKTIYGNPYYFKATVQWCKNRYTSGTNKNYGKDTCQSHKDSTYKYVQYSGWQFVEIKPSVTSYTGPNSTTRTYAQEMTNYANWWAWYRTRLQMMKTGVSRAFSNIRGNRNDADATDKDYFHARVGFSTISDTTVTDSSTFLKVDTFNSTQKTTFFSRLHNTATAGGTPLLGALSKAGRIYAGKFSSADPVQYSCQRNFTILSTDGYWNNTWSGYDALKEDNSTYVGDQDGATGVTKPSYDGLAKSNTLADVAYYYYHTDLRSSMDNNVPPAGSDAAMDDFATWQHMTTFTVGIGVDGTLAYQTNYKTATSGDFYDIKQGTKNWPDPINNSAEQRIDDLWHAAVNGRGTYYSARDPDSLVNGLTAALGTMESASGSGAAAATSNLQPTSGDNFIYIANYRTVFWDGELGAYTIDLTSGAVSSSTAWTASTKLATKIASTGDSDTRTIYTSGSSGLKNFTWSGLTTAEKAYFDNTKLSQYADWDSTTKTAATGETMVNFLRGQDRNEDQDRPTGYGTYTRLYRDRAKILGDIVHSQPVYVGEPLYTFSDTGYTAFTAAQASRAATLYVSANDGMLHAFDATTGDERWAYIPPMVLKNLWRLADKDYATNHRFFLDGPLSVTDIYSGSWRTILVGAMGKGGRGYYALDITNPSAPSVLWTFTADDNNNLGYSYGAPMITKVDGTWVVLIASGYNNVPESGNYSGADGVGRLFMLNAATGSVIKTISTGVGSTGNPSGLAKINIKVDDFMLDNSATTAYGGDLYGNMWRFNLSAGTASKLMSLGSSKPIAVAPELGEIDGKTIVFFGTGRYLGEDDLNDSNQQSIYAVRDDGSTTVSSLNSISFSTSGTSTGTTVDWSTSFGWYGNLPTSKERTTLDPQLYFGTVLFGTTIPAANECQPGGYGRVYEINYYSGETFLTTQFTSPPVGVTVAKLPGGTAKVYVIEAKGGIPSAPQNLNISTGAGSGSGSGNRVMWRELAN